MITIAIMAIINQFGLGWWSSCTNLWTPFTFGLFKFLFTLIETATTPTELNTRKVSLRVILFFLLHFIDLFLGVNIYVLYVDS